MSGNIVIGAEGKDSSLHQHYSRMVSGCTFVQMFLSFLLLLPSLLLQVTREVLASGKHALEGKLIFSEVQK